ncbi:ABC transporter substrate-binding protein [Lichenibacterium minor]|uniref:ABC transporter substrate-binding protein n=1 Tax=Lichenibacterium minor TaxID=2316528 RepID=UPI001A915A29
MLTPEPPILVPGVNNQAPTLMAAAKVFQGLLAFTPKLEPLPYLARSWDVGDDKLTYTFHLRDGIRWHDGRPFTAEDVVFSVMAFATEVSPRARAVLSHIRDGAAP